jgi:hypothetical protein
MFGERVEHARRSRDVGVGVPRGFRQRLSGTGFRRQMNDHIRGHVGKDAAPVRRTGDIALDQLHAFVKRAGALTIGVDLRMEVIQCDDAVETIGKLTGDRTTDEACTAGD